MNARSTTPRRGVSKIGVVAAIVASCVFLLCLGCTLPVELVVVTLFGWIYFLWQVIPEITVDGPSVALAVTALTIFVAGAHALLGGWWRELHPDTAVDDADSADIPSRNWPLRRTLAVTTITLLLFVAGISMVGITHQLIWLSRADAIVEDGHTKAARRTQSLNHLKQIGLGVINYDDANGMLPFAPGTQDDVEPLHGWQTAMLPFMEHQQLHEQIDMSQSWLAEVNRVPLTTEVQWYTNPGIDPRHEMPTDWPDYAPSHYAANRHLIGPNAPQTIADVTDGTSQTIFAGEVAANIRPWGHPANYRDPVIGINKSPDGFGSPWPDGAAAFNFADGSVRYLNHDIDPKVLRALATPAGGDDAADFD